MTMVRMKVAKSELTFSTPTLAKDSGQCGEGSREQRPELPREKNGFHGASLQAARQAAGREKHRLYDEAAGSAP
jgi:hypothetical protein